jgi:hypothetical protein
LPRLFDGDFQHLRWSTALTLLVICHSFYLRILASPLRPDASDSRSILGVALVINRNAHGFLCGRQYDSSAGAGYA